MYRNRRYNNNNVGPGGGGGNLRHASTRGHNFPPSNNLQRLDTSPRSHPSSYSRPTYLYSNRYNNSSNARDALPIPQATPPPPPAPAPQPPMSLTTSIQRENSNGGSGPSQTSNIMSNLQSTVNDRRRELTTVKTEPPPPLETGAAAARSAVPPPPPTDDGTDTDNETTTTATTGKSSSRKRSRNEAAEEEDSTAVDSDVSIIEVVKNKNRVGVKHKKKKSKKSHSRNSDGEAEEKEKEKSSKRKKSKSSSSSSSSSPPTPAEVPPASATNDEKERIVGDSDSPSKVKAEKIAEKDDDGTKKLQALPCMLSIHPAEVLSICPYGIELALDETNQSCLCHISQVSALDIQHPNEIVSIGDIVWVKIIDVDYTTKSVLGSMKFVAQHNGRDLDPNNMKLAELQRLSAQHGASVAFMRLVIEFFLAEKAKKVIPSSK